MKLTQKQLRKLINEEVRRDRMQTLAEVARRLNELHPGTSVGTAMKQGVEKVWEADKLFQQALAQAPDDETWNIIDAVKKAVEKLAYQVHDKIESAFGAKDAAPAKKRPLPQAKPRAGITR
jgi:hypothetical protein